MFSRGLADLMVEDLRKYSVNEIIEYERSSYSKVYISKGTINQLKVQLEPYAHGSKPVKLGLYTRNLDLFNG